MTIIRFLRGEGFSQLSGTVINIRFPFPALSRLSHNFLNIQLV